MGGHNAGEVASSETVKTLKDSLLNKDAPERILLLDAINFANNQIFKMSVKNPAMHGMGTTVTACIINDDKVTTAQVGDSRLYLIRNGTIAQITKDHSLVEMLIESGEITKEDAKHHPQKNVITKAIGTNSTIEPDFYEFFVKPDDVILICSDGLFNMVEEEKILSLVESDVNFSSLADVLVKEAEAAGGHDNITVILIRF